jgi:hypothetical protein
MKNIVAILLSASLLSACATAPSESDLANADYGSTSPMNYKEIITAYLNDNLKDPESAKIKWVRGPYRGYFAFMGKFNYGYIACAEVNAKNSYGGYSGATLDAFLIRNGRVVEARFGGGDGLYDGVNQIACSR